MIVLGIVLGSISLFCCVIRLMAEWIETHDTSNATEKQIRVVMKLYIILTSPFWGSMVLVRKAQQWRKRNVNRKAK